MRIYIAGPMRGKPDWNWASFEIAEALWKAKGHTVFNPCRMGKAAGYTDASDGNCPKHLRHVMLADVACIVTCDAIALLPGWNDSIGATFEVAVAQFLDMSIYNAVTHEVMQLPNKPWTRIAVLDALESLAGLSEIELLTGS